MPKPSNCARQPGLGASHHAKRLNTHGITNQPSNWVLTKLPTNSDSQNGIACGPSNSGVLTKYPHPKTIGYRAISTSRLFFMTDSRTVSARAFQNPKP